MNLYTILNELNIHYEEISHKAVYNMSEVSDENICAQIDGFESKALFVKNKKRYYIVLLCAEKKANLKELSDFVGEQKLSFAKENELKEILNLEPGSVSPLGIVHDKECMVKLLIDKDLTGKKILLHPNINTKTISIAYEDLLSFINYTKHTFVEF